MTADLQAEIALPPFALLELLADGEVHSGQELADLLGVSRTAIWKQLSKLDTLGLNLQSKPGQGYCLSGGIELLVEAQIRSALSVACADQIEQLVILKAVDSTNAYLLQLATAEKVTVCLAECQTAGRGRRGRHWVSPFAKNIYLSLKFSIESGFNALEGLSLAIGVALVRALTALGITDAQLKWPNDVLWRGRKLGGVLIEVVGDPAGRCHLVIGIGLNIHAEKSMQIAIDQPWVSLAEVANAHGVSPVARNQMAAAMLNEMVPLLAQYEQIGFSHYRAEWQRLNAHAGAMVDVHVGSTLVTGRMLGVNTVGALVLSTATGEQVFHGGEVSVREVVV